MPGSRPPTESLRDVEASGLLSKVPARMKNATRIFSDGNRAWVSVAKKLKLKCFYVNHQNKEWARQGAKTRKAGVSAVSGTKCVDRAWRSLKVFIPATWPEGRALGMHPFLPNLVNAYMWRKSCGSCTAAQVAQRLHCALKRR